MWSKYEATVQSRDGISTIFLSISDILYLQSADIRYFILVIPNQHPIFITDMWKYSRYIEQSDISVYQYAIPSVTCTGGFNDK